MSKDKFIEVVSKLLQANVAPTKDSGLHLQRVSIAERKLPVAAVIRRNAKLMDAEHFDAWYNEVTGN